MLTDTPPTAATVAERLRAAISETGGSLGVLLRDACRVIESQVEPGGTGLAGELGAVAAYLERHGDLPTTAVTVRRIARQVAALEADLERRRALTYTRGDVLAECVALRARAAELEGQATRVRSAVNEYDYLRRECPFLEPREAGWQAVLDSAHAETGGVE